MPMPRPVWSGTISFGLVAIPIKMFHAVSKKSVSFNQLDERTLSRIRLKKVSAETGEDVPDEYIVKGYEISKGRYVVVDPDELEPFIPSATKSIDLEEFVDQIPFDETRAFAKRVFTSWHHYRRLYGDGAAPARRGEAQAAPRPVP